MEGDDGTWNLTGDNPREHRSKQEARLQQMLVGNHVKIVWHVLRKNPDAPKRPSNNPKSRQEGQDMFCGLVRDWASSESVARGRGGLKASDRKPQETKRQVQAIERLKGLYREKTAELPGTRLAFWRGAGTRMEVVLPVCRKKQRAKKGRPQNVGQTRKDQIPTLGEGLQNQIKP